MLEEEKQQEIKEEAKKDSNFEPKIYSKNQLWLRISGVIIFALALVIIWLLTATKDPSFASHFSFASTVASIILSVLAIFMSISGEAKTQVIRDKIEREADDVIRVSNELERQIRDLSRKFEVVVQNTASLKATLTKKPANPLLTSFIPPADFSKIWQQRKD